ncbi:hypothetical protein P153DRAFT_308205 [Dothidotthia symphoricarpi CBS 119687]|uniref:Uncharacterized protein n=1 Tax=Dothidotthia symphoricarpi CBS 119687 TaxID=1392245 RepID=A0A6A6ANP0_9PLEO|nr:uncharacterized protein P153DRAFT_308205 [Dothidotthia symphoricarpi CBS 119687]KAF2133410.1 hypothetical protein P153DRAFT_308205 [Dothidotthia symphoricarpi CBS 119687]
MPLKITIPQKELTPKEERKLNTRVAAAARWVPKLTRPFPARSETTKAYPLKLMRHYSGRVTSTEPNFVKPRIDRSSRVEKLLHGFPTLSMSTTGQRVGHTDFEALRANKRITKSEKGRQLAWKNFASREIGREDRGREAMLQSGLFTDDLVRESNGQQNQLPEWRKLRTGKFARMNNGE